MSTSSCAGTHSAEPSAPADGRRSVDKQGARVKVNQYLVLKSLGEGAYGEVKLVYHTQACGVWCWQRQRAHRGSHEARRTSSITP